MKKLLVIRNDRLGDLMLILPALRIIKSSIPDIEIDCLADENYEDLSLLSGDISNVISDANLSKSISDQNYNYSLSFFSTFNIAYKLWKSNIKKRYAPATKLAQLFYNRTIKQSRSKSLKPEYEYNNDLACYFLKDNDYEIKKINTPLIRLSAHIKIKDGSKKNIFVHPFTGGSSKTLSDNDFIKLCSELHKLCSCKFVLHCDKFDYEKCLYIKNKATNLDIDIIKPTDQLTQMFSNINECDLFISGSTGPLHVAGSLNKKTVGFYPSKKSSTSLRWSTMNEKSNKLSFEDSETHNKHIKVNINSVADEIYNKLLK
jgi:ADP-heptose:LPS heptosyltransferase